MNHLYFNKVDKREREDGSWGSKCMNFGGEGNLGHSLENRILFA